MVHLSEADAERWPPLLKQVALAKEGCIRPAQPSIADGYEAVSQLRQQHKRLTDSEVNGLVFAYREGCTILELAARFGCDRKTVTRYLKLHCVETRYRRLSETQVHEAIRMYRSGLSLAKIGKHFGVDPKTIKARLVERGLSTPKCPSVPRSALPSRADDGASSVSYGSLQEGRRHR